MRVGLDIRITLHREPPKDGSRSRAGLVAALGGSAILHLLSVLLLLFYALAVVPPPQPRKPPEPSPTSVTFIPFRPPAESRKPPPRGNSAQGEIAPVTPPPRPSAAQARVPSAPGSTTQPAPPPPPQVRETKPADERASRTQVPFDPSPEGRPRVRETTQDAARPGTANAEPRREEPNLGRALSDWRRGHEQERVQAGSSTGGSHDNVFAPDPGSFPVRGAPYGILEFESRDYDWSDYSSQIYWAILRAWYRRLHETTPDFEKWAHENGEWTLSHQTRIRFVIEKNGDVSGIAVEAGSGCTPLDRSAVDALSEVVLPPLPADFPRDSETVHGTFIARGDITGMRQTFRYLKQINYF